MVVSAHESKLCGLRVHHMLSALKGFVNKQTKIQNLLYIIFSPYVSQISSVCLVMLKMSEDTCHDFETHSEKMQIFTKRLA